MVAWSIDSTAVTNETTTTSGDSLGDEDDVYQSQQGVDCRTCHDPLVARPSVAVYLDQTFGTLMLQDPDAPCVGFQCRSAISPIQPHISPALNGQTSGSAVDQPVRIVPEGDLGKAVPHDGGRIVPRALH